MVSDRRTYKVAEKLRGLLSRELITISDSRFFLVTITSVVVNQDLSEAKVYWSVTGGKERLSEVTEAFNSSATFIRKNIARNLGLRSVPRLRFYYDDTVDTMAEVGRLLAKVKDQYPESVESSDTDEADASQLDGDHIDSEL
jgi:ribosome-binding factor A